MHMYGFCLPPPTVRPSEQHIHIQGFRYQLYCAARAESTQHCVVRVFPWSASRWDGVGVWCFGRFGIGGGGKRCNFVVEWRVLMMHSSCCLRCCMTITGVGGGKRCGAASSVERGARGLLP